MTPDRDASVGTVEHAMARSLRDWDVVLSHTTRYFTLLVNGRFVQRLNVILSIFSQRDVIQDISFSDAAIGARARNVVKVEAIFFGKSPNSRSGEHHRSSRVIVVLIRFGFRFWV
jgi:hypothetical protein